MHQSSINRYNTTDNQGCQSPALTQELLLRMMEFEVMAGELKTKPNRFDLLTRSEAQALRAKLVADYIAVCAASGEEHRLHYDILLNQFCETVCDMNLPLHELMGTYLASLEAVAHDSRLAGVVGLQALLKNGIMDVLRTCADMLHKKTDVTAVHI